MIILRGKKILVILACVIMGTSAYMVSNNLDTIQTSAVATNEKTVVLDAGHGAPDRRR